MAIKDSERFLPQALQSIAAQSVQSYEIVVIDGGSRDGGPAIARSQPKTVCIPQSGKGFADAWNTGIAAAHGHFIAFLDSDDLWTPKKLEWQLAVFANDPSVDYVFGRTEFFLEPGVCPPRGFRRATLSGSHLAHFPGAAMIRRSMVERMGPFSTRLQIASDIAWFAKLRYTAVTGGLDSVLLRKRIHGGNLSVTTPWPMFKSELFEVLKERVDEWRSRAEESATSVDSARG
jgi:glycosyltransferase involved in cell wall biosynthesis